MMKRMTTWQRLNIALVLMILLLLAGFCVFFWTEKAGSESRRLVAELTNVKDKLRFDLVEADDAIRGLLFDPKHETNTNRWRQANADLTANINAAHSLTNRHAELAVPSNNLHDFALKKLNPFHNRVLELAETNVTEAVAAYNKGFGDIRDQRDRIFSDLAQQIEKVKNDETSGAEKIAIVGTGLVAVLVLLSIGVGFMHSSAVKKPSRLRSSLRNVARSERDHSYIPICPSLSLSRDLYCAGNWSGRCQRALGFSEGLLSVPGPADSGPPRPCA